jgi:hypothetical protein
MKVIIVAALLLLGFPTASAEAQTPCPASPSFTLTIGDPVTLTIAHATSRDLGGPRVEIEGNLITIWQIDFDVPPPPGVPGPPPCNDVTAVLGALPPGNYNVSWHYAVSPALPGGPFSSLESFAFAFSHGVETVPALDGKALLGLLVLLGSLGVIVLRR